ncbi:MAG: hypothetical protein GX838_04425 [Clostridiaceae bacterium]|nr:hypothetical protein [Clostridiaceae bacterium]
MIDREDALRKFVEEYEIEVPASLVENEYDFIVLNTRHMMHYDSLSGGGHHPNLEAELSEQEEDMRVAAHYELKSELVLKAVIKEQEISVSRDELEQEALAMARRQNVTMEQIIMFFGEDLAMLERDIKQQKAINWICEQIDSA